MIQMYGKHPMLQSAKVRRTATVSVRAEQASPSINTKVKSLIRPLTRATESVTQLLAPSISGASTVMAAVVPSAQKLAPERYRLQSWLATPGAALAALAAFSATSYAVFGPAHLTLPVDSAAHAWVAAHTTPEWRRAVGEALISDAPINAGVITWVALSGRALAAAPRRAAAPVALCWAMYFLGAGAVPHSDPTLVHTLKEAFARVRPSLELHHTFAYPSGHTTAATFIVGAALVVLLPLALRLSGGGEGTRRLPDGVAIGVWGGAAAVTACGRVLADAHWVSDTFAGACLAVGCVAVLSAAVEWAVSLDPGDADNAKQQQERQE